MWTEENARTEIRRLWDALPAAERHPAYLWGFYLHTLQDRHPHLLEFGYGRGTYAWERVQTWCLSVSGARAHEVDPG